MQLQKEKLINKFDDKGERRGHTASANALKYLVKQSVDSLLVTHWTSSVLAVKEAFGEGNTTNVTRRRAYNSRKFDPSHRINPPPKHQSSRL